MSEISDELRFALAKLDGFHRRALEWFAEHDQEIVAWSALSNDDFRLASLAKGIYKPKELPYAISVKQTLASPYADSHPESHDEGGWIYRYHQEEIASRDPALLHTNLSLDRCRKDDVPVGVLIQVSRKPEPTLYRVWGIALVRYWLNGIFLLEGQDAIEARTSPSEASQPTLVSIDDYRKQPPRRIAEDT